MVSAPCVERIGHDSQGCSNGSNLFEKSLIVASIYRNSEKLPVLIQLDIESDKDKYRPLNARISVKYDDLIVPLGSTLVVSLIKIFPATRVSIIIDVESL